MNIGIVGCGYISGIHVMAWRDLGLPVVAACDLNKNAAIQFTKEWNIPMQKAVEKCGFKHIATYRKFGNKSISFIKWHYKINTKK